MFAFYFTQFKTKKNPTTLQNCEGSTLSDYLYSFMKTTKQTELTVFTAKKAGR